MKKIGITTGDLNGIGFEITEKSLKKLNLKKSEVIIIGKKVLDYDFIAVDEADNGAFCYNSLQIAAELAKKGEIKAIVTSPVSKEVLHNSGFMFNGQTEILEKLLQEKNEKAQMLFIARDMRVMLLTRHMPLSQIKITKEMIISCVQTLNKFLIEKCKINSPKIAMLALNPHAGENGILGREELDIINPATKNLEDNGINITRALVADATFASVGKKYLKNEAQEYDAIVACYHDQALCPVKALAFDKVVNTTIGLSVIRTSPSHGTAYDIVGKNLANADSMIEAILLAQNLA